jgi:hypothetical protein
MARADCVSRRRYWRSANHFRATAVNARSTANSPKAKSAALMLKAINGYE